MMCFYALLPTDAIQKCREIKRLRVDIFKFEASGYVQIVREIQQCSDSALLSRHS